MQIHKLNQKESLKKILYFLLLILIFFFCGVETDDRERKRKSKCCFLFFTFLLFIRFVLWSWPENKEIVAKQKLTNELFLPQKQMTNNVAIRQQQNQQHKDILLATVVAVENLLSAALGAFNWSCVLFKYFI